MVVDLLHPDGGIDSACAVEDHIQPIVLVEVDLGCHSCMVVLDVDHIVACHLDPDLRRTESMEDM